MIIHDQDDGEIHDLQLRDPHQSLELSYSTASNPQYYPPQHLAQLQSIHKHLRFDSLQSSSSRDGDCQHQLYIYDSNQIDGGNHYCDHLLPLASPELSSASHISQPQLTVEAEKNDLGQHFQDYIDQ